MRRICCVCKKELEPVEPLEDERITHTICEYPCYVDELAKFERSLLTLPQEDEQS